MRILPAHLYQHRACEIAEAAASEVSVWLKGARVEHIGASAIPGAASKGDVDLCALVAADHFELAITRLESQGYRQQLDTLRTDELCMLTAPRSDIDLAVQVIVLGSAFEFFLHFRDVLRGSPELVDAYNRVKLEAAHLSEDDYRAAKSRFIEAVLAGDDQA